MFSRHYPPRNLSALKGDCRRVALGTAYALRPHRLPMLPRIMLSQLRTTAGLERRDACLDDEPGRLYPHGFAGLCGSLTPETLMRGFTRGLFPFSHVGPKKWWMHPERMVIAPHAIKRDKDVRRMLRNRRFTVTFDTDFSAVMDACADPRSGKVPLTWITPDIVHPYLRLHRAGHAHSFEVWDDEGNLAGGGFGIAVGPVFVIESQFTRQRNASKIGMVTLMRHLSAWGFTLADGKIRTGYLEAMGFSTIPQTDYVAAITRGRGGVLKPGPWTPDPALDASVEWEPSDPKYKTTAEPTEQRHKALA